MSPSASAVEERQNEDDDQGGVHPVMKTVVFACMAGAMIWTIAVANTAGELPNLHEPSEIALHLLMIVLLIVCAVFLLAMVLMNCIHAIGRIGKWRNTLSCGEKQHPLLV